MLTTFEGDADIQRAERLFITVETMKVHVRHIIQKLGASDRTGAVLIALRWGIIRLK
jgi:DNA-binding NarL/FixJ family response regulator